MDWKRKKKDAGPVAVCQLRGGQSHPFGALRGFTPLGTGEERIYRQMREAVPVLDAAVGKLVRLAGGFSVKCGSKESQEALDRFLKHMPCGHGQTGIHSFFPVIWTACSPTAGLWGNWWSAMDDSGRCAAGM